MTDRHAIDSRTDMGPTPERVFHSTLSLLKKLTAISSPSGDRPGLERAMDLFGEALSERDLKVDIRPMPDAQGQDLPVLSAHFADHSGDRDLLLVGHMDTVLPAIPPRREGGRLWATGAVDMKGGLACLIGALDLLRAQGRAIPRDLSMVVVPDEEVAGFLSWQAMRERGKRARALWVLEPGQPLAELAESAGVSPNLGSPPDSNSHPDRKDGETLVVGRRGLITWALDVTGRSAHAGNGFWAGRSALVAASQWSVQAAEMSEPGRGATVNPGRFVAGEAGFVEALGEHADLLFSPRQTNVVPDRARVEGEARFLTTEEGRALEKRLNRLAAEASEQHRVTMQFQILERVPPLPPLEPSRRWARLAIELARKNGWHLESEEDRRGISFPNMLDDPSSVPTLDGLGPVGGGMHTREEFVDLRSLNRRISLLAGLLEADARSSQG